LIAPDLRPEFLNLAKNVEIALKVKKSPRIFGAQPLGLVLFQ
jgi:hypothetical protein